MCLSNKLLKNLVLVTALLTLTLEVFSQVVVPFRLRYGVTQKGNIVYVTNSMVTCNNAPTCPASRMELPPAGTTNNNADSNSVIDIDLDPSTFSSSSDSLKLPICSEITWAGLYWGSDVTNSGSTPNYAKRDSIYLKIAGSSTYTKMKADTLIDNAGAGGHTNYFCYKNVTSLVQSGGRGLYTVANLVTRVNRLNISAGWTIVVAYRNDYSNLRNLAVFDGLNCINTTNQNNITLSGFQTPIAGPISFEVGHVTHDGDRGSTGDSLLFNDGIGVFNPISDVSNPSNNIYNSTITNNGANVTSRVPYYTNTLGFDADIFVPNNAAKNFLTNNQTSVTLRESTGGENFYTQVVHFAIDVYEPDLRLIKTAADINGGTTLPGDTIEYNISVQNLGSDTATNIIVYDTIPFNADYVAGSIEVLSGPNTGVKTDASGDDQGEYVSASRVLRLRIGIGATSAAGGRLTNVIPNNVSAFKFRAVATAECVELLCSNVISNQANSIYRGYFSGSNLTVYSQPSGTDVNGCPLYGPTTTSIVVPLTCSYPVDTTIMHCASSYTFSTLNSVRPGYTYYNSSFSSVVSATSSGIYYGIRTITPACIDTFTINMTVNPTFNSPVVHHPTCGTNGFLELVAPFTNLDSVAYSSGGTFSGGTYQHINSLLPALTLTPISAGVYTFRVKANNGCFIDRTRTFVYVNCSPLAADDNYSSNGSAVYSNSVGSNDDEPDADLVTFSLLTSPAYGSITFRTNGTFDYNPGSFRGTVTFTYLICDNRSPSLCDTGLVTITIVSPLPVELTSFTGMREGEKNILEWVTASELNNDYFLLERSNNASDFETIAKIKGNITSNVEHKYFYTDVGVNTNTKQYYRLKQFDFNGHYEISKTIEVTKKKVLPPIELFPNPNKGLFRVKINCENKGLVTISVVSQFGSEIYREEFNCLSQSAIKELTLKNPPKGLYYLIINGNGSSTQTKFSVN
ncbi:MAG TPA: Ig-like domain-containing protein [Bacteroidia bacterium]|nr:Ig-like domain-containing protein [Bacteroidia bacterium]HNU34619.1 Ig-like domain-containing protein [Bacteroidia bacterium]